MTVVPGNAEVIRTPNVAVVVPGGPARLVPSVTVTSSMESTGGCSSSMMFEVAVLGDPIAPPGAPMIFRTK